MAHFLQNESRLQANKQKKFVSLQNCKFCLNNKFLDLTSDVCLNVRWHLVGTSVDIIYLDMACPNIIVDH
jgi:hypothetical protein